MARPGRTGVRAPVWGRIARVGSAAARPFASIRTQIVLLVVLASVLISLLATWVATDAVEEFLTDRIEVRFPQLLAAKSHEVRLWYDRVGIDLYTFANESVVRHTLPAVIQQEPGDARRTLHVHLIRALSRSNRYAALAICSAERCPLVGVGTGLQSFAGESGAPPEGGRSPSYGVIERGDQRRQLLSVPVLGVEGASLRAMIDLRELDRLLATGITRPSVELYVVDADGRYIAGSMDPPREPLFYRGPGPAAPRPVALYENDRGDEVIGAALPVGRYGWTMVVEQDHAATTAPVRALIAEVFRIVFVFALLLAVVAVALALSIVWPLEALSNATDRVAEGESDIDLPRPRGARELRRLTRAFNAMTLRLGANRRELERRAEELQRLSVTDGLTGLYNHRHFQEQVPLEAKRAERANLQLALILVDIDDFKAINDTFGHAVGDGILCAVARAMSAQVRAIDLLARYGGEEFAVLTQQRDEAGALTLADKIRRAVAEIEHPLPAGAEAPVAEVRVLRLTVSVGVGFYAPGGDTEAVFDAADGALYTAKLAGKNRVELGRPDAATDGRGD